MTSILERLDDWIRGGLHRFVDRALEGNSLILYDQDVRDMEQAIAHYEESATTMYAAARANERRQVRHQEGVERLERRLERLTIQGLEPISERMMVAQAELEAQRNLVVQTQSQIERQQAQYETLAKGLAKSRLLSMTLEDERPRLESLLVLARAYRSVERVELTLEALRGLGGDTEVAMVADSIYQRFNQAQTHLEMIDHTQDLDMLLELEKVEVQDQLLERRRRLGLEPEQEVQESPLAEVEEALPEPETPEPQPDQEPSTPPEPAVE